MLKKRKKEEEDEEMNEYYGDEDQAFYMKNRMKNMGKGLSGIGGILAMKNDFNNDLSSYYTYEEEEIEEDYEEEA